MIPFGRVAVTSFRAASISRVSFTVSTSGCFSMETMTPGLPMKPPSPRFTLGAKETSAQLAQIDRRVADVGHHDAAQVVEAHGPADVPDQVLSGVLVGEAAAGVGPELGE